MPSLHAVGSVKTVVNTQRAAPVVEDVCRVVGVGVVLPKATAGKLSTIPNKNACILGSTPVQERERRGLFGITNGKCARGSLRYLVKVNCLNALDHVL